MKKSAPAGNREPVDVTVARISARQAVVVSIVTAVAGIITGLIAAGALRTGSADDTQRWLRIEGIETQAREPLRLIIMVNGRNYSYPSTAVWLSPGPRVPRERFELPRAPAYAVSFRAFLQNGDEAGSPEVREHTRVPAEDQVYELYGGASVRGGDGHSAGFRVLYSVR